MMNNSKNSTDSADDLFVEAAQTLDGVKPPVEISTLPKTVEPL